MAKRFGDRYSNQTEQGGKTWRDPEADLAKARPPARPPALIYIAPAPLLVGGLVELMSGDVLGMVSELLAFAMLIAAPALLAQGMQAQRAFEMRRIAKPPVFPRKVSAAVLSGLGVALAAASGWGMSIALAAVLGATTSVAHVIAFGIDPVRAKGLAGQDRFQATRVARAVDQAESAVREILDIAETFNDRDLELRVARVCNAARAMFRTVEEDPRDLTRARKFMTVYLNGARDATRAFADLYGASRNTDARTKYLALLDDLEDSFEDHREMLLADDQTRLDVEIEVLRERLQTEGLRAR